MAASPPGQAEGLCCAAGGKRAPLACNALKRPVPLPDRVERANR